MDLYAVIKALHIISATVLMGTGLGIAFFFFCANGQDNLAARYFAAKTTVLADFLFTLPAVILQPITGFWLVEHAGYRGTELWLAATYGIYIMAGICWLPVVWIQIRLKNMLRQSVQTGVALPDSYRRLFRVWVMLGCPAFFGLAVVFFLMVVKPV